MKYCPLCAAEYQDAADHCVACGGAALVDSLGALELNLGRLLWEGSDRREFDAVARLLNESEIPAELLGEQIGLLAKLASGKLRIRVLQADFDRALQLAASATGGLGERKLSRQTCHACLAECSSSLAACPRCQTKLKTEHKKDLPPALQETLSTTTMKYCPICDAEYEDNHVQCSVCGIDLVPEHLRGQPLDERQRKEKIQVVWRGGDPVAVSEVIRILREAGIRHHVQPSNEHMVFELGMPRPKYAVRVFASDATTAKELLIDVRESSPFVPEISEISDEAASPRSVEVPYNPAAATIEVWSGADAPLAELLEACLRENRVGVRREGVEPGPLRLLVMAANEEQAREIIREVREATPPA